VIDRIVQNHPVDELLEQSKAAELVVVGSHGRNVLARSVLGSVSAALVTRAECPVAVLRPGSWPAAADPR
jgi:nucleotide-binding universal stress UspA family protein